METILFFFKDLLVSLHATIYLVLILLMYKTVRLMPLDFEAPAAIEAHSPLLPFLP
jgi:hypothetical protein